MNYYPALLDIHGMTIAVIGGGEVAARKIRDLIDREAVVKVVSPRMNDEIFSLSLKYPDRLRLVKREYQDGDLEGAMLVFSAADDAAVNRLVFDEAKRRGILINSVDDPDHCTFIVPSWFQRDDLIVSVSTSGSSPAMAARLRREIEQAVPENIEEILRALRMMRTMLQEERDFNDIGTDRRGDLMKKVVSSDQQIDEMVKAFRNNELLQFIRKNFQ